MPTFSCPNCQFENPAEARFCQNCGQKLERICSNCSTANAAAAKYCMNCGTSLAPAVASAPTGPGSTASERRVVTVLFCDVKGSTALAEQLDPERWTEIMDGAFQLLTAAILRYNGTVARLMGDAILALFGAPTAHEDDPLRAVRAGLDILSDMEPYQQTIRTQLEREGLQADQSDFAVRVGINTGLVVVGRVGSEVAGEYTAMGDAVNVASRMEQTAAPDTVQIAYDTYRLVATQVEAEQLGAIAIKGKRGPVDAYRILGLKSSPGRPRGVAGMEAPLVGRQEELGQLSEALTGLNQGLSRICFITGEAGLGKSRLLRELQAISGDLLAATGLNWFQVSSLSFENDQPYGLIRRLVRRLLGVTERDSQQIVRERIERFLEELPAGQQERIHLMLQTLFGSAAGEDAGLEGEALGEALADGMLALWEDQARRAPVVLVFDDLHWTDSASTGLIARLLPLVDQVSILFLCVFRPDRDSAAGRLKQRAQSDYPHRYLEISLLPLTLQESSNLASTLLTEDGFSAEVHATILARAEGIPFYLEELVREMVESGVLVRGEDGRWLPAGAVDEIAVPENLESLLVSRMDRLDATARHTLQLASVIGRSFYYRVLALVAGEDPRLEGQLLALQQAGLIQEVARLPEREYEFRHGLTRQAAYNTILLKERRQYHRRVGQVMAELFAGELEEFAPVLARHFDQAGDQDRAADFYTMAANNAFRLYANDEALGHYGRALAAAGLAGDAQALAGLHIGRGATHERLGHFDEARADLEKALELARSAGDMGTDWRASLDLGKLWAARDYDRTGHYFRLAMELARQMDDPATLASSLNRLGNWYVNAERPSEGIAHHHEALAIFDGLGDKPGLAGTLDLLGMANAISGDFVASVNYYRRAVALFHELDDRQGIVASQSMLIHGSGTRFTLTEVPAGFPEEYEAEYRDTLPLARQIGWRGGEIFTLQTMSERDGQQGDFSSALQAGQEALRLATEIEHRQWTVGAYFALGLNYMAMLAWSRAREHLEQALRLAREIRSQFWLNHSNGQLALAYLGLNQPELALAVLKPATGKDGPMQTTGLRCCWLARAETAMAQGDPALCLDVIERLIAASANMGPGVVISVFWLVRGQALLALDRPAEAEEAMLAGLENSHKQKERALTWRFHAALAKLYRQTGRPEKAEVQAGEGLAAVKALAANIPDEELAQNFDRRARKIISGS